MPKTLLVPLDGSHDAERALPVAETLAERFGADIAIAVDRDPAPLVLVRDVGATHVVTSSSDTAAELLELTRGRGADLVLDLVGSDDTLALGAAVTRQLGHLTLVGIAVALPVSFFAPIRGVGPSTYWGSLPEARSRSGEDPGPCATVLTRRRAASLRGDRARSLHGRAVIVP